MKKILAASALALSACLLNGCSREPEQPTADVAPAPQPVQPAVESMQFGSDIQPDGTVAGATSSFSPGQPVQLAVQLEGVSPGTPVTVQWYGPEGEQLAYEIRDVAANQDWVTFVNENTQDWDPGNYRAEVWVGDRKLQDQSFEITADAERAAATDETS